MDTFFAIYRDIALTEYNKACVEGEKYRDAAWVENPDFLSHRLWKQADKAASDLADIIEEVILLAWNTIENEYHSFDENLEERPQIKASSEETKALAEIYVKIAKTYIDQSIKEVEKILPKIFLRKKKVK